MRVLRCLPIAVIVLMLSPLAFSQASTAVDPPSPPIGIDSPIPRYVGPGAGQAERQLNNACLDGDSHCGPITPNLGAGTILPDSLVKNRLKVFNVEDQPGAVCNDRGDGTTNGTTLSADDTTSVLAAVALAKAAGHGTVLVNRTCRFTGVIDITNITLACGTNPRAIWRVGAPFSDTTALGGCGLVNLDTASGPAVTHNGISPGTPGAGGGFIAIHAGANGGGLLNLSVYAPNATNGAPIVNASGVGGDLQHIRIQGNYISAAANGSTSAIAIYTARVIESHFDDNYGGPGLGYGIYASGDTDPLDSKPDYNNSNTYNYNILTALSQPWHPQIHLGNAQSNQVLGNTSENGPASFEDDGSSYSNDIGGWNGDAIPGAGSGSPGVNNCVPWTNATVWQVFNGDVNPNSCLIPAPYNGTGDGNHMLLTVQSVSGDGVCPSAPSLAGLTLGNTTSCADTGGTVVFKASYTGTVILITGKAERVSGFIGGGGAEGVRNKGQATVFNGVSALSGAFFAQVEEDGFGAVYNGLKLPGAWLGQVAQLVIGDPGSVGGKNAQFVGGHITISADTVANGINTIKAYSGSSFNLDGAFNYTGTPNNDLASGAYCSSINGFTKCTAGGSPDLSWDVVTLSSSQAVAPTRNTVYLCDATAAQRNITGPAATGSRLYIQIKKIDSSANACKFFPSGSDTIDGIAAGTGILVNIQYASMTAFDGASTKWSRLHTTQLAGDVTGLPGANTVAKVNGNTPGNNAVSHQFVTSIDTSARGTTAQPASTDLSDLPVPLTSGGTASTTASGARTNLGAAATGSAAAHQFATVLGAASDTFAQPASTDLSDQANLQKQILVQSAAPSTAGGCGNSVSTPTTDVVNCSTSTIVYTGTVPGGSISTTGKLQIELIGDFLNNSGGNVTLTIIASLGGVNVLSNGSPSIATSAAIHPWVVRSVISAEGASAENAYDEEVQGPAIGTAGLTGTVLRTTSGIAEGLTLNMATGQVLTITVTLGTAAATAEFRVRTVRVWALG